MIILKDSMVDYIFLSREIPLPLSALQIIERRISFHEVMNFSESKFKSLLLDLKNIDKISIREIDNKVTNFVKKKNNIIFKEIESALKICKDNEIQCISFFDKKFPLILKKIKKPPKLIFIKGEIRSEDEKAVAIIGTRNPTHYGKEMATKIAKRFTELGFTIISGLARGIDTIAIKSALDNGGRAIGVIASGILNLYPKENQNLVEKLITNGALISERFPLKNINKKALQIRNRVTSGLGLGNVFVEGNKYSGTKWQFKFGEEQDKPAFAVEPINENCEQAFIPNWLLKEKGSARISTLDDIDWVAETLVREYDERKTKRVEKTRSKRKQTSIMKY